MFIIGKMILEKYKKQTKFTMLPYSIPKKKEEKKQMEKNERKKKAREETKYSKIILKCLLTQIKQLDIMCTAKKKNKNRNFFSSLK